MGCHREQGATEGLIEVEFPQMLMPFMVAIVLLFSGLLVYGTAMQLIVRVMVRLIRVVPASWDTGRVPLSWPPLRRSSLRRT